MDSGLAGLVAAETVLSHSDGTRGILWVRGHTLADDSRHQREHDRGQHEQRAVERERELAEHDPRLTTLPRVMALSKADLVDAETRLTTRDEWIHRLGPDVPVIVTSAATGEGCRALIGDLYRRLDERKKETVS